MTTARDYFEANVKRSYILGRRQFLRPLPHGVNGVNGGLSIQRVCHQVPEIAAKRLGLPHMDTFFMRRVAFRHDATRPDFDDVLFCDIFNILQ